MRSKTFWFAAIVIIVLLSVSPAVFAGSEGYLVPSGIMKTDGNLLKGYVVFSEEEVLRMDAWVSGRGLKKPRRTGSWVSQGKKSRKESSIPPLLDFESIGFREGGFEAVITYGRGKEPVNTKNFLTGNRIRFTRDPRNPTVLPEVFPGGNVLWIKRTGKAQRIQ